MQNDCLNDLRRQLLHRFVQLMLWIKYQVIHGTIASYICMKKASDFYEIILGDHLW